ncbi:hypothetical protein FACS1894109_19080 [Spirochaetia bacterium]|nr:hypothetical protein FACS1894109_19080 [Spirochaetia bacterium]
MKMKPIWASLIALATVAIMSCSQTLDPTDPDLAPVTDAYGVDGVRTLSGTGNYPNFDGNPSTATGGSKIVTVYNFPNDIGLDILNDGSDLAALTTSLKAFLSFHNISNTAPAANTAHALIGNIDYTVIRREGTTLTLELTLAASNVGAVAAKIDGTKYSHHNGILLDRNNDGKLGEAFYDDFYDYTSISIGGTPYAGNIPAGSGGSVSQIGSDNTVYSTSASLGAYVWTPPATATTGTAVASLWISDSVTNYAATIPTYVTLQKYNGSGWDNVAVTWTVDTVIGNYVTNPITVADNDLYRFKYSSAPLVTTTDFFGGKRKIYFVSNPDVDYEYSNVYFANNFSRTVDNTDNSTGWFTQVYITKADNARLGIRLNVTGSAGNQGLKTNIDGAKLKVGYFPSGLGSSADWSDAVLFDVTATLRYADGEATSSSLIYAPSGTTVYTKDQLYLEFADAKIEANNGVINFNGHTWYLFLSPDYGYLGNYNASTDNSRKFGDWENYSKRIDGKAFFAAYQLGTLGW